MNYMTVFLLVLYHQTNPMVPRALLIALFTHTGLLATKTKQAVPYKGGESAEDPKFRKQSEPIPRTATKKGSKMKMLGRRSYPTPSELSKPGPDRSTGSRATEIRLLSSCKGTGA